LAVASPTQTASPVVLFRLFRMTLEPADAGIARQQAVADLQLTGRSRKFYSLPTEHESKGRFTQRTSINESHEPPSE
jgi:hypothetical protein